MFLRCQGVQKSFRARPVLSQVSFEAGEREALCIVGGNGAGKTTLLNILARLLPPDAGEVYYLPAALRRRHGAEGSLAQALSFAPDLGFGWEHLTVSEEFQFFCSLFTSRLSVQESLDRFQLTSYQHSLYGELSAGYRKRVGLSLAFSKRARAYLFDEPFSHLDADGASICQEELAALAKEALVILTSPTPLSLSFPTRFFTLSEGVLTEDLR